MRQCESQRHAWIIQPLLDAGLKVDEISGLLLGLTISATAAGEHGAADGAHRLVLDRSPRVVAAWLETVDRMITSAPQP